jgi:hypothetical protein
MELIERYLQAVGFWLPKTQKQDILAELSEDIRSQVEDRESSLGRKLTDAEAEEILKQRGSPIMVANRYLPQQHLIGPVLFPIYRLALKFAWIFYFVPWLVVWLCLNAFFPSYRGEAAGNLIVGTLHGFWLSLLYTFASVTFAFAIFEKYALKSGFLEKWNPRKLPPLRDPNRIKRSNSIAEIVSLLSVSVFWLSFFSSPVMVNRPDVHIVLAPAWRYYFWWIVALLAVTIATSCANLFRPYWTRFRAGVRLVTDAVGWAMFAWLCKMNIVAEISVRNVPAEKTAQIASYINLWMGRSVPIIIAIGVVIILVDIYRIVRVKNSNSSQLSTLAAMVGISC